MPTHNYQVAPAEAQTKTWQRVSPLQRFKLNGDKEQKHNIMYKQ